MKMLKVEEFQNRVHKLIDSLDEWWTEISLAEFPYDFDKYSKRIDGFIQDLEGLRDKSTINIGGG